MFDVAWSELLLVAIVAILVVGPKDLPKLLRTLGRMLGGLRRQADQFRKQFDDAMKEAGGEDLQREMNELRRNNPLTQVRDSLQDAVRQAETAPKPVAPKSDDDPPDAYQDDVGPPPPPLPPREKPSAEATAKGGASSAAATADPGKVTPSHDAAGNGADHEPRINGEHHRQAS